MDATSCMWSKTRVIFVYLWSIWFWFLLLLISNHNFLVHEFLIAAIIWVKYCLVFSVDRFFCSVGFEPLLKEFFRNFFDWKYWTTWYCSFLQNISATYISNTSATYLHYICIISATYVQHISTTYLQKISATYICNIYQQHISATYFCKIYLQQ